MGLLTSGYREAGEMAGLRKANSRLGMQPLLLIWVWKHLPGVVLLLAAPRAT